MATERPSLSARLRTSRGESPERSGKIDTRALSLTAGILWGTLVAFLELAAGTRYGERWRLLLADIYPGYSHEPGDRIWGTLLGFIDAAILGYLFGEIYNRLSR